MNTTPCSPSQFGRKASFCAVAIVMASIKKHTHAKRYGDIHLTEVCMFDNAGLTKSGHINLRLFSLFLSFTLPPRFVHLCEDAYLILRRRAALFINLLAMMLQTGIPELHSIDDLNCVRDALVLGVTEKEAKEHFHSKLQEARHNAWSTSLNWYIHGLAKDNRQ